MDTEDYPCCQMPFVHSFKEGELAEYYKDWELVNIMGILAISIVEMRMAIDLNFWVTMLAKKNKEKAGSLASCFFAFYKTS